MMPEEYNAVRLEHLKRVARKWKKRSIEFQIAGCQVWWHTDRTGAQMWLLGFVITSAEIIELRNDLGLMNNEKYTPHMILVENVVGYE